MIPNQWYVVMDSAQVKDVPVGVTRMGEKLVFWRDTSGVVSCLRDRCVHRGVQLSAGKILKTHLQCPFHGFEYAPSGRVVKIPAIGKNAPVPDRFKVHAYPTYEDRDFIWIWWGEDPPEDLKPPRFLDGYDESFSYGQVIDPWDAHYSRVIENQLDVVHLPFVHHDTIGRGGRTLVDGPVVRWADEYMFYIHVFNRVDDGTLPREAEDLDPSRSRVYLQFVFPNLWQNRISEDIGIVAAFVPVDAEHTLFYLRFYQRFLRVPLLKNLVNRLAMPYNLKIAHQDRRVVQTQLPKPSSLSNDEQLIPGDRPIVEYRRRREELISAAQNTRSFS